MIHEQRGKTHLVAEIAEKPPRVGTAGFPTRVLDPKKGLLCTYTAPSRAAWVVDVIGGIEKYRQVELEEIFEAQCARDIGEQLLDRLNPDSQRAAAMMIAQNVGDWVMCRAIRRYTAETPGGSAERRFLAEIGSEDAKKEISDWGVCKPEVPDDDESTCELCGKMFPTTKCRKDSTKNKLFCEECFRGSEPQCKEIIESRARLVGDGNESTGENGGVRALIMQVNSDGKKSEEQKLRTRCNSSGVRCNCCATSLELGTKTATCNTCTVTCGINPDHMKMVADRQLEDEWILSVGSIPTEYDFPGGKEKGGPRSEEVEGGIAGKSCPLSVVNVSKLVFLDRTDLSVWTGIRRPAEMRKRRSQESKGSSRETFARILMREIKEEMALCNNLMLNIERMTWERPSGDAWGMVEAPNGVMHRIHVWVYEVQPHERSTLRQTYDGLDELMMGQFRPWTEVDRGLRRQGITQYADIVKAAIVNADSTLITTVTPGEGWLSEGSDGDFQSQEEYSIAINTIESDSKDNKDGQGSDDEINLCDEMVKQAVSQEISTAILTAMNREAERKDRRMKTVIEEVILSTEDLVKEGEIIVLLSKDMEGKMANPTMRWSHDEAGNPWLAKRTKSGINSDPREWVTSDRHVLYESTNDTKAQGKPWEKVQLMAFGTDPSVLEVTHTHTHTHTHTYMYVCVYVYAR